MFVDGSWISFPDSHSLPGQEWREAIRKKTRSVAGPLSKVLKPGRILQRSPEVPDPPKGSTSRESVIQARRESESKTSKQEEGPAMREERMKHMSTGPEPRHDYKQLKRLDFGEKRQREERKNIVREWTIA